MLGSSTSSPHKSTSLVDNINVYTPDIAGRDTPAVLHIYMKFDSESLSYLPARSLANQIANEVVIATIWPGLSTFTVQSEVYLACRGLNWRFVRVVKELHSKCSRLCLREFESPSRRPLFVFDINLLHGSGDDPACAGTSWEKIGAFCLIVYYDLVGADFDFVAVVTSVFVFPIECVIADWSQRQRLITLHQFLN